ncbi:MAG: hypothetical protein ABIH41_05830, partial [Nanoarchaeota archaeon]
DIIEVKSIISDLGEAIRQLKKAKNFFRFRHVDTDDNKRFRFDVPRPVLAFPNTEENANIVVHNFSVLKHADKSLEFLVVGKEKDVFVVRRFRPEHAVAEEFMQFSHRGRIDSHHDVVE